MSISGSTDDSGSLGKADKLIAAAIPEDYGRLYFPRSPVCRAPASVNGRLYSAAGQFTHSD